MIGALLIPHLPSLAVELAIPDLSGPVLIQSKGAIVCPPNLAGIPAERARTLVPEAVIADRSPALEQAAWQAIVDEVFGFTPLLVDQRPGRLFLAPDNPAKLRKLIERTDAKVGLAPTRTLALLSALQASPGSIMTVDDDDVAGFLNQLPVSALTDLPELELEEDVVEKLRLFGLAFVGSLRQLSRRHLDAQFGPPGLRLHGLLTSIPDRQPLTVYRPPIQLSHEMHFTEGANEPPFLEHALMQCLETVVKELGVRRAGRLEVALLDRADAPFQRRSRLLKRPTNDERSLRTQAATILQEMVGPDRYAWGIALRLASILPPEPEQIALFRPRATASDLAVPLAQRFPAAIKRILVKEPWAYTADRFASIETYRRPETGDQRPGGRRA